ncbi:unnamed protein product [Microthlaspi erraticum]|uniref:Uncharacterized protein n=1 Tax=Microthlaspi erraticum TaxID=1685480 RepID=A0A6D2JK42_9BRAS|nr:unnamed protein product [Microthlaspi erraticum]
MFLRTNSTSSKIPRPSLCHHVGTWSPQSPWRREHHSALGTWGAHPLLPLTPPLHGHILIALMLTLLNLLIDLFSFLLESHHSLIQCSPNLKLSLRSHC